MAKIMYLDLETSGLDPLKHGIVQIAAVLEKDDEEVDSLNIKCAPAPHRVVDIDALVVSHTDAASLGERPSYEEAHRQLVKMLSRHIDKYDKTDKAFICGYNSTFDIQFLRQLFLDCKDSYFGSWFWSGSLDVMVFALNKLKEERKLFSNFKLSTVAARFGVKLDNAHDAMDDVRATMAIYKKLFKEN